MLGGNKHKQAPSLKSVKKVEDDSTAVELPRPIFRGFLGGDVRHHFHFCFIGFYYFTVFYFIGFYHQERISWFKT